MRVESLPEQTEHFSFAVGESHGLFPDHRHGTKLPSISDFVDETGYEGSRNRGLALQHASEGDRQSVWVGVFEQIAGGPGSQRIEKVFVIARNGQHHDRRFREGSGYLAGCLDPAARHADVE